MRKQYRMGQFALKIADCDALLNECTSGRDHLILATLIGAGLRRAEVAALAWQDIDLGARRIHVLGKGDKWRLVPISPTLAAEYGRWRAQRSRSRWVFPSPRRRGQPVSVDCIAEIVEHWGRAAGLRHPAPGKKILTPHLLRHTFARRARAAGVSLDVLAEVLGHEMETTASLYGIPSEGDIRDRLAVMWLREGEPKKQE